MNKALTTKRSCDVIARKTSLPFPGLRHRRIQNASSPPQKEPRGVRDFPGRYAPPPPALVEIISCMDAAAK